MKKVTAIIFDWDDYAIDLVKFEVPNRTRLLKDYHKQYEKQARLPGPLRKDGYEMIAVLPGWVDPIAPLKSTSVIGWDTKEPV